MTEQQKQKISRARKTSSTPTRIYKYRLPIGPDADCLDDVTEQFRLTRIYQQSLIVLHQERAVKFFDKRRELCPELAEAEAKYERFDIEIEEAKTGVRSARRNHAAAELAKARELDPGARIKTTMLTRKISGESKTNLERLKEQRAQVGRDLKTLRAKANKIEALKDAGKLLRAALNDAVKVMRKDSAAYEGSRGLVEEQVQQSVDDLMKIGKVPKPKRWDETISRKDGGFAGGPGRIGVSIRKETTRVLTTERLLSCQDTRLRLERHERTVGTGKSKRKHMKPKQVSAWRMWVRIGSEGKRKAPVWATFPIVYHRPLPPGAEIKRAWVQREKISKYKFRWHLCITVESETFVAPARLRANTASINFGWSRNDQGRIRVGYVVGTDGHTEEIVLPERVETLIEQERSLKAIRDRRLDDLKETIAKWDIPKELEHLFEGWQRWRSHTRFARLAHQLRVVVESGDSEELSQHRAKVDALLRSATDCKLSDWERMKIHNQELIQDVPKDWLPAFEALVWAKQDHHLELWQHAVGDRARRYRKHVYRLAAKRLAEQYTCIVGDGTNISEMARRAGTGEEEKELERAQRSQRFMASPYELINAIGMMAKKHGSEFTRLSKAEVGKVKPGSTCYVCGESTTVRGDCLIQECERCGAPWDRDANHCRNLLAFRQARSA